MKLMILLAMLAVTAFAKPAQPPHVHVVQDTKGNYEVHEITDNQKRVEQRTADGSVIGTYGYKDPSGVFRSLQYRAGKNGFEVIGGNLSPIPFEHKPQDAVQAKQMAIIEDRV